MTYDTDKELTGYVPVYRAIAARLGPAARVCELGVQAGGSLRMWQDLFPCGLVAGVDVNPGAQWPEGTIRILCDQDSDQLPGILREHAPAWDLIVDDASHAGAKTRRSFDLLWPLISPGGFYVIEDWFIGLPHFRQAQHNANVHVSYDPGLLQLVQDLLTRLDRPYPGSEETAHLPRDSDVESVDCRYGLAVVRKYDEEMRAS